MSAFADFQAVIDRGLTDESTRAEQLAYHEAKIEIALRSRPATREQAGTKRDDRREHVVYTCSDEHGVVLYVGISLSVATRLSTHANGSRWFSKVVRIDLERVPNRDAALRRELELIAELLPLHNRTGARS